MRVLTLSSGAPSSRRATGDSTTGRPEATARVALRATALRSWLRGRRGCTRTPLPHSRRPVPARSCHRTRAGRVPSRRRPCPPAARRGRARNQRPTPDLEPHPDHLRAPPETPLLDFVAAPATNPMRIPVSSEAGVCLDAKRGGRLKRWVMMSLVVAPAPSGHGLLPSGCPPPFPEVRRDTRRAMTATM